MARLALRSPQFKYKEIPVSGVASTLCEIIIDSISRYSLIKNVRKSTTVNFDISELARDYLSIYYDSTYVPQEIAITTTLTNFSGLNATGSVVGLVTTFADIGYEGYGYFEENTNPTLPIAAYLISKNTTQDRVELYLPTGETSKVPQIVSGAINIVNVSSGSISIGGNYSSKVYRIDCTKYGIGRKIIFINRYGVQQDLWFFLKELKLIFSFIREYF